MTIKCIKCKLHWNISIKKDIHPKGYICPIYIGKIENSRKGQAVKQAIK